MADPSGTPRLSLQKAQIGGLDWFVLEQDGAQQAGGRAWVSEGDPYQGPTDRFEIALKDFSQGAGFTYEGPDGTYDRAAGWELSAPGKPTMWPLRASGAPFTCSADFRGWQFQLGVYLYVCRGRLVCKYAINDAAGATWPIIERHDLGASNVIAGRPIANFIGAKAYVPIRAGAGGSLARFHELTTVATTTVEQQTVTITGTPTSGTYVLHFDGKDTAAIAFNAIASAVQTALRLVPGLEDVTVSSTGSTPNFVHTVVMTGVAGAMGTSSPPAMTVSDTTSGGTHGIAIATTVAGVSDTWTQGPASCEARNFRKWKGLLFRSKGNQLYSVSADPMVDANWAPTFSGAGYAVGDASQEITDMCPVDTQLLSIERPDGVWTFNESLQASNRLTALEAVVDATNGVGAEEVNGQILVPHKAGLVAWAPGTYHFVGAEQDGALDAGLSEGWGRVQSIAPYGKYAFYVVNDTLRGVASLMSLQGSEINRSHQSYFALSVPHQHQEKSAVTYESVIVIQSTSEPVTAKIPAAWTDDSAVGTITWSNPTNAAADDGAFASAAVGTSHYLKGLNPGGTIPSSATIQGIKATVKRKVSASATPAFRNAQTASASAAGIAVTKPTGTVDGDFLLAVIEIASVAIGSPAITAPAGWALVTRTDYPDRIVALYSKTAASEGASWTWSGNPGNWAGCVGAWSAVDTANPFADPPALSAISVVSANVSNQYTYTMPATTEDHVRIVGFGIPLTTDVALTLGPASMSFRAAAVYTATSPHCDIVLADLDQAAAGTAGTLTWTGDTGSAGAFGLFITVGLRGAATVVDSVVRLVKGGTVVGSDKKDGTTNWPSAVATVDYGGSNDLWGTSWTPADVNGTTFGVVLSALVSSGLAYVDTIYLTVYYSLPGNTDTPSYLSVLEVDATRLIATPRIYQLARNGLPVANDPNLSLASSGATLYSSRYFRPARGLQKTWDCVETWLEASPATNTPGLQIWASVDEGAAFQLLDENGDAATLRTTGFHQVFFPATAAAVGHYVALQFRVPALGGVEVPVALTFRDTVLRGHYRPLLTETIKDIVIVLDKGQFEDMTGERRSVAKLIADLSELAGPNDGPVPYRSPIDAVTRTAQIGYCAVLPPRFKEVSFKGFASSALVAVVTLRKMVMPRAG